MERKDVRSHDGAKRRRSFREVFGRPSEVTESAPGRVNLIGEHTDYNGGFVLPIAIPQRTTVELASRPDTRVVAYSSNVGGEPLDYTLGAESRRGRWIDYVQGVTQVLAGEGFALRGVDLTIASNVPLGSGLSSSAALEVALLRGLREAFHLDLDDLRLALLAQRAENNFVGAPVGVMDQMAASLAEPGLALFIDTRTLRYEQIPLPKEADLVVIDSGISHNHAAGHYRTRRKECEDAAAKLGVSLLSDIKADEIGRLSVLEPTLLRRARHVITENLRVLAAVRALRERDLPALGTLLYASHDSMRDDFEVSTPEIDRMVELAKKEPDVYGARMTGGGFGGSVIMLSRAGSGSLVARRVTAAYDAQTQRRATILLPTREVGGIA